ncbi:kelch repeat-containing protein, partial [Ignavibacterium sp.]
MKTRLLLTFSSILILSFTLSAQNYGVWKEIDSMNILRTGHSIVELPDGNIMVSGNDINIEPSSCEIYDNTTGKWRFTTNMNVARFGHTMILLNNGLVISVGGN